MTIRPRFRRLLSTLFGLLAAVCVLGCGAHGANSSVPSAEAGHGPLRLRIEPSSYPGPATSGAQLADRSQVEVASKGVSLAAYAPESPPAIGNDGGQSGQPSRTVGNLTGETPEPGRLPGRVTEVSGAAPAVAETGNTTPNAAVSRPNARTPSAPAEATVSPTAQLAAEPPVKPDLTVSGDPRRAAAPTADVSVSGANADQPAGTARPIQLLVKDKSFKQEKDGSLRVTYDDLDLLKVLNMDPVPLDAVAHFPAWLKELSGRRVRIPGFMYPTYQETGITAFVLARDNQICCFGRSPKVYDLIQVRLKPGAETHYIQNRSFDVVGTFRIEMGELLDEGLISGLYYLDEAHVIEK